jgi:hypothetical protein
MQPAKSRTRIKVVECGTGHWDEQDHGLDISHGIGMIDFKLTGTGHKRIERMSHDCCADRQKCAVSMSEKPLEQSIAK